MDRNNNGASYRFGLLPDEAPLAMAYVPIQKSAEPAYESIDALSKGTLFPGLDLPFMNLINKNELPVTPLTELQTLGFVLQELALYLDTHRDDKEAFEVFKDFQKLYAKGREKYEKDCGPLTHMSAMENGYSWLCDPWPWEYAANREV